MNFEKIKIEDISGNEINKAIKHMKQRIYSIVKSFLDERLMKEMNIKDQETITAFTHDIANRHAGDMTGSDYALTEQLTACYKHIEQSNFLRMSGKDEDSHNEMIIAVKILDEVNAVAQSETLSLIDRIVKGIKNQPFDFDELMDIKGMGWKTVSKVYLALDGTHRATPEYCKAYIKYCILIYHADNEKKLWMTRTEIKKMLTEEIIDDVYDHHEQPSKVFDFMVDMALNDKEIAVETPLSSLHTGETGYASADYYYQYYDMMSAIMNRMNVAKPLITETEGIERLAEIIAQVEEKNGFPFNLEQREGIYAACQSPVFCLTGKAGTGKSSSTRAIVQIFKEIYKNERIMGGSFTGQATHTLRELTKLNNSECATLHRWIACNHYMSPEDNILPSFKDVRYLIVDEFSMVELSLLNRVLEATKDNQDMNILFVGDLGQLPSIGLGFAPDFVMSKISQQIEYTTIVRQGEDSVIAKMANQVYDGVVPEQLTDPEYRADKFRFISRSSYDTIVETSATAYVKYIQKNKDMRSIGILANTVNLVNEINRTVQEKMAEQELIDKEKYYRTHQFSVHNGDRVVCTKNFVDVTTGKALFNGARGVVKDIKFKRLMHEHEINDVDSITIEFDMADIGMITFDDDSEIFRYLVLAYATTTHKSQGATIKNVILAIGRANMLNSRQLIYVGMSRASETLTVISSPNIITSAIHVDAYENARYIYKDIVKEINRHITL